MTSDVGMCTMSDVGMGTMSDVGIKTGKCGGLGGNGETHVLVIPLKALLVVSLISLDSISLAESATDVLSCCPCG